VVCKITSMILNSLYVLKYEYKIFVLYFNYYLKYFLNTFAYYYYHYDDDDDDDDE